MRYLSTDETGVYVGVLQRNRADFFKVKVEARALDRPQPRTDAALYGQTLLLCHTLSVIFVHGVDVVVFLDLDGWFSLALHFEVKAKLDLNETETPNQDDNNTINVL